MTDKLTKAQERVLRDVFRGCYPIAPGYMKHRLRDAGYLFERIETLTNRNGYKYKQSTWEITAKGLQAIHAPSPDIAARMQLESQRQLAEDQARECRTLAANDRAAERKARIIAKVREAWPSMTDESAASPSDLDDDELWQLITSIVEIHEGTT